MLLFSTFYSVAKPNPDLEKKIEKAYKKQDYAQVLELIADYEQRAGKAFKPTALLLHYKVSSLLYQKDFSNMPMLIKSYFQLTKLDNAATYWSQQPYIDFKDISNLQAIRALQADQYSQAKVIIELFKQNNQSLPVDSLLSRKPVMALAVNGDIYQTIHYYHYSKIDSIARTIPLQHTLEDQAWALTKNYKSDIVKIRAIAAWITHNMTPDEQNATLAEATFRQKKGDKKGYALLFQQMCKVAGIDSDIIHAETNGKIYQWNFINFEGKTALNIDLFMADKGEIDAKFYLQPKQKIHNAYKASI
jgi:hypothetical protein